MVHSVSGCTRGVQVKLMRSLGNACQYSKFARSTCYQLIFKHFGENRVILYMVAK